MELSFKWRVRVGGYIWVRAVGGETEIIADDHPAADSDREFLVENPVRRYREPRNSADADLRYHEYDPLQTWTGLFLDFAGLKATRAGIRDFANLYGNLGAEVDVLGLLRDREPPEPSEEIDTAEQYAGWARREEGLYRIADTRDRWTLEIRRMKKCVAMWKAWKADKSKGKKLAEVVITINNALLDHSVACSLAPLKLRDRIGLHFVPRSLAGALWSQFARALTVAGNGNYRNCAQCGRWFELNPLTARTSRQYCRGVCRTNHHRAKKIRAAEMAKAGQSHEQIARELSTSPEAVGRWISSKA